MLTVHCVITRERYSILFCFAALHVVEMVAPFEVVPPLTFSSPTKDLPHLPHLPHLPYLSHFTRLPWSNSHSKTSSHPTLSVGTKDGNGLKIKGLPVRDVFPKIMGGRSSIFVAFCISFKFSDNFWEVSFYLHLFCVYFYGCDKVQLGLNISQQRQQHNSY